MPRAARMDSMVDQAKQIGDDVMAMSRNAYLFGLGTMATAQDEVRGVFDRMCSKGEVLEKNGDNVVVRAADKVKYVGKQIEETVSGTMSATLNRAGVPSADEIRTLIRRVGELTEKVDKLAAR